MTEEMIALGRRAVACKDWRWMPGMLAFCPDEMNDPVRLCFGSKAARMGSDDGWLRPSYIVSHELPDLTDPATLGCLLALVREAYPLNRRDLYPRVYPSSKKYPRCRWTIYAYAKYSFPDYPENLVISANSEAEVLVAALEAAP